MVDVGGYRLSVRITGTGTPTVVCLASLGGGKDEWSDVAALLSESTTVVTYARAGIEDSDPLPAEQSEQLRDAAWFATQLRALLQRLEITPPYIFASGSIGGFIADRYAETWPDEVAGLVLTDPTNPSPFRAAPWDTRELEDGDGGARLRTMDLHAELKQPRNGHRVRAVVLSSAVGRWLHGNPDEWAPTTLEEVDRRWQAHQREWVDRLSARHVVADSSGHHVAREEPRLVAAVVEAVVEAARAGRDVHLDPPEIAAVAGYVI